MSYFGDVHPSYFGNVVKAMASAKQGYPVVSRVLAQRAPASDASRESFFGELAAQLLATVHKVERLTPTIVEVTLHAPLAARKFQPGQFYRLQNFETLAPLVNGTRLQMEGLAMTGAWVDPRARAGLGDRARDGRLQQPVRDAAARRAGDPDGPDRRAHAHRRQRDRGALRRRPRQRGAVLDRRGLPRRGLEGAVLRRLQEGAGSLQGRRTSRTPPT